MTTSPDRIEQLSYAIAAVHWLADHPRGLVDMHGLTYWAGRVETLRAELAAL